MRGYITYISKRPMCRICGKPMDAWVFGVPSRKQAHPECEGAEFARISIKEFSKRLERR